MTSKPAATAGTTSSGARTGPGAVADPTPGISDVEAGTRADPGGVGYPGDIVDEWGRQSFPASDPPANW